MCILNKKNFVDRSYSSSRERRDGPFLIPPSLSFSRCNAHAKHEYFSEKFCGILTKAARIDNRKNIDAIFVERKRFECWRQTV